MPGDLEQGVLTPEHLVRPTPLVLDFLAAEDHLGVTLLAMCHTGVTLLAAEDHRVVTLIAAEDHLGVTLLAAEDHRVVTLIAAEDHLSVTLLAMCRLGVTLLVEDHLDVTPLRDPIQVNEHLGVLYILNLLCLPLFHANAARK
jgi:hypothetical protein